MRVATATEGCQSQGERREHKRSTKCQRVLACQGLERERALSVQDIDLLAGFVHI